MKTYFPKTEYDYDHNTKIDQMELKDAISFMNNDQSKVFKIINLAQLQIETVVNSMYNKLNSNNNGRIIYSGAGTSGRIGVQDGAELYPTFGWPKNRLSFIIAGGKKALLDPVEQAEDNTHNAKIMVKKLHLTDSDVILGLAASGNTPFTTSVLEESKKSKSLVIAISNNPYGKILEYCDHSIILDTGPEVLTGSTRLKAATAQKICLNIISTLLMSKLGRIKNGRMSHMIITNEKLRLRSSRISLKKETKGKKN